MDNRKSILEVGLHLFYMDEVVNIMNWRKYVECEICTIQFLKISTRGQHILEAIK